ncbi:hypothetical protein [Halococcus hamelinensis]|uniref:Uncharacterized protein n=1 Tax=Halococcus hamelinensis 100A6 TaxID=1132509 RepID=M0M8Y6_9EURY|nr:hypothetical protein [Halococcus hamelinensis]EMA41069.1 hypothetical protein C447_02692 [Halococcus hamelinensis 100A6]
MSAERGATIDKADRVVELPNGNLRVTGSLYNGTDTIAYTGARVRLSVEDRDRVFAVKPNGQRVDDLTGFGEWTPWGAGSGDSQPIANAPEPPKTTDDNIDVDLPAELAEGGLGDLIDNITGVPVDDDGVPWMVLEETDPDIGLVSRPMYSTRRINLDVGSGGDVANVQTAFNMLPRVCFHDVDFEQVSNTRGEGPGIHTGPLRLKEQAHLHVEGNGHKMDAGINGGIVGKTDHFRVKNATLGYITQCYGAGQFINCKLRGNGKAAFSGKAFPKTLNGCDVGRTRNGKPAEWYGV